MIGQWPLIGQFTRQHT